MFTSHPQAHLPQVAQQKQEDHVYDYADDVMMSQLMQADNFCAAKTIIH